MSLYWTMEIRWNWNSLMPDIVHIIMAQPLMVADMLRSKFCWQASHTPLIHHTPTYHWADYSFFDLQGCW